MHRKTPVLESPFSKHLVNAKAFNCIIKKVQHRRFPVFLRKLQNFSDHLFWRISGNDCFRSFFFFSWLSLPHVFTVQAQTEMVEEWWGESLHWHLHFSHNNQRFGRENDGNCGKFIGSNLVIFCYKEFEKFASCKSFSQSEAKFIVYSDPIESGNVKINFS